MTSFPGDSSTSAESCIFADCKLKSFFMYTNKQIWSVSYPILLSLLAQNVINVTDTAFLGRVSEIALGASAMGGLFYICIFTIAFGFSTGSQIVIARRNGEARYTDMGPVMIQGVLFLLAMALLLYQSIRWQHHAPAGIFRKHL